MGAEYNSLIELLAVGLCADAATWRDLRWKPTEWTGAARCTKGQVKTLEALADIVSKPSPVAVSALLHPVFSAEDIFGVKHATASRSSSTSASSTEELRFKLSKHMLTAIVKEFKTGVVITPKQNVKASARGGESRPGLGPLDGKNKARNAQRKANARK